MFRVALLHVMMSVMATVASAEEPVELKAHVRALRTGNTPEKVKAAQGIAKLGTAVAATAVPVLCEAIADPNTKVCTAALEALESVEPKMHQLLATLLLDNDERKRSDAMQEVSQLENVEITIPVLICHLRNRIAKESDAGGVPGDLARAMDTLQSKAPKNVEFIKVLLAAAGPANERNKSRNYAIRVVSELAAENDRQLPQIKKVLVVSLADRSPATRVAALGAIGRIGPLAKELAPTVKKLKLDGDAAVREAAGAALEKIQGK